MSNVKVVLGEPRTNRATTTVELAGTSNESECTRESEMPGAYLAFFIPQPQAAKMIQPCERAFHNPAPLAQPAAMFRIAHGQPRPDLASTQSIANVLGVVGSVPSKLSGRQRGRPRCPWSDGMPSSKGKAWLES